MKMFLLSSDRDALTGFRLAGVQGKLVGDEAEFESSLNKLLEDKEIAVLLITSELFEKFDPIIVSFRKKAPFVITQIPDSKNREVKNDSITRYIQDAVGIKV